MGTRVVDEGRAHEVAAPEFNRKKPLPAEARRVQANEFWWTEHHDIRNSGEADGPGPGEAVSV
jgi:hypothetical protein